MRLSEDSAPHTKAWKNIFVLILPLFSPNFVVSNCLVVTILSHRYNSRTGLGETKVESHASSDTQPNHAALLLNTVRIQPGSQPHQCVGGNTVHLATLFSVHCARPTIGVAGARWDKDIPTGQPLPNPIVRRPTDLSVAAGYDRTWARTQSLWWHSWHCSTTPLTTAPPGRLLEKHISTRQERHESQK
jgi:hypothetical protein